MSKVEFPPLRLRTIIEALLLCVVAAVVGLSVNYTTVYNAFSGKAVVAKTGVEKKAGPADTGAGTVAVDLEPFPVELDEIDDFIAEGALLVDARSAEDYREGHLEGAVSLPLGQADVLLEQFKREVPLERTLILYCSGFGCPDSHELGMRLIRSGYTDILVYEGGFPEWRDTGRTVERGAQ